SAIDPAQFVTASSPHTLKKLLLSWPLQEQRRFFEEELSLPLALEPETGKLFPVSNKSRDVRDRLRDMAERDGAELRFDSYVTGLEAEPRPVRRAGGEPQKIYVRWTTSDAEQWDRILFQGEGTLLGLLRPHLPARLAETLLEMAGIDGRTQRSRLRREERRRLVETLTKHALPW